MKIKICGMKYRQNIHEIIKLKPDFIGFIFYQKSKRFVGETFNENLLKTIPKTTKTVAVFVNESIAQVINIKEKYGFDYVQLHGDESPKYCEELFSREIKIIKAFRVDDDFDFNNLNLYAGFCNLFLFDTKAKEYGGTGKTFNWKLLENYKTAVPFLLSGGIGIDNIEEAMDLYHPMLYGFDINSKLEIQPSIKSKDKTELIIKTIRNYDRN